MWYVVTDRMAKFSTGSTEKFAPRQNNRRFLTISGPFPNERFARRISLAAMQTHTCLATRILEEDGVREIAKRAGYRNDLPLAETMNVISNHGHL